MGLLRVGIQVLSRRGITSKVLREVDPLKPPPFDWKKKSYPLWKSWFDITTKRFDENTKLIVVDGPPAVGKTEAAEALADQLDMHFIPDATMDLYYINDSGYDLRQLDPKLPRSLQSYDATNFCKDPYHENAAGYQLWMLKLRYSMYVDALAHVLSTGQGVVIERSPWADKVFFDAMVKNKYLNPAVRNIYNTMRDNTLHLLMRPHLVIYLDIPVSKVQQNLKKRNNPWEVNSKALTTQYLEDIETNYKTNYLPQISTHAELLMYEWSQPGDIEVIVEDIERIDFDKYTKHDAKLKDWCLNAEREWAQQRRLFADSKRWLLTLFDCPVLDAPEVFASGEDVEVWHRTIYEGDIPGMKYENGFEQGSTLFKIKGEKYLKF